MTPVVSVILTSYNRPQTVARSIQSVLNQTFSNWEVVIMDDNSGLDTVNSIKGFLNDSRIRYYNSLIADSERYKTTRYATLINEAIPKTNGTYITYLTDDNIFLPERFDIMVNYLQNNGVEIVYSKQQVNWLDEKTGDYRKGVRKTYGILTNPAGLVDHCSVMHSRAIAEEVFKKYGSYWDDHQDYWNFGDAVFWNRLTKFKPFYPIRKVLDIAWKEEDSFQKLYLYMPKTIPNGTLVRGTNSSVFLIDNQIRRIIDPQTFSDLKYDSNLIVRIPDPFLFKYTEGVPIDSCIFEKIESFPNQRLVTSDNISFYYIQNNKKHLISNEPIFHHYKFYKLQPITISDSLLKQISEGPPIEELNKSINILPEGILYKCQNHYYICLNQLLHLIEENVADKLKLPITDPVVMNMDIISRFNQGAPFVWKQ